MRVTLLATTLTGLIAQGGAAAWAEAPKPARAITRPGEYKLFDGKLAVKVTEAKGKLTYRITRVQKGGAVTLSPPKDLPAKGAVWVIFPASADDVWIFWGSFLGRCEHSVTREGGNNFKSTVITGSAILKRAPKAVLEKLPREVVAKLKDS
jgi:hypothetical protein